MCPTGIIHIKDMLLFNINDNKIKKELLDYNNSYSIEIQMPSIIAKKGKKEQKNKRKKKYKNPRKKN